MVHLSHFCFLSHFGSLNYHAYFLVIITIIIYVIIIIVIVIIIIIMFLNAQQFSPREPVNHQQPVKKGNRWQCEVNTY